MGQITVAVNNRNYVVACEDGQENHVQSLAGYIDRQAQEMTRSVGQVGEGRILLLAALVVADELSNVLTEVEQLKHQMAQQKSTVSESDKTLIALEQRIERLIAQIESGPN